MVKMFGLLPLLAFTANAQAFDGESATCGDCVFGYNDEEWVLKRSPSTGSCGDCTRLLIDATDVESFDPDVFVDMTDLEELLVMGGDIYTLPADLLDGLTQLELFYISKMGLQHLPPSFFDATTAALTRITMTQQEFRCKIALPGGATATIDDGYDALDACEEEPFKKYVSVEECTEIGDPSWTVIIDNELETCSSDPAHSWYNLACDPPNGSGCSATQCRNLCINEPRCWFLNSAQRYCRMFEECDHRENVGIRGRTREKKCKVPAERKRPKNLDGNFVTFEDDRENWECGANNTDAQSGPHKGLTKMGCNLQCLSEGLPFSTRYTSGDEDCYCYETCDGGEPTAPGVTNQVVAATVQPTPDCDFGSLPGYNVHRAWNYYTCDPEISEGFVDVCPGTRCTAKQCRDQCEATDDCHFMFAPGKDCYFFKTCLGSKDMNGQYARTLVKKCEETEEPTSAPTLAPTNDPASRCSPYTHDVLDHKFLGSGSACRGGVSDDWRGGKTCDSPYIICLPDENTPMNPDPSEMPNLGLSAPSDYSVKQCAEECAFDQRCQGFELLPAAGTTRGACVLIDDLGIVLEGDAGWPAVGATVGSVTVLSEAHIKAGLPTVGDGFRGRCCHKRDSVGDFEGKTGQECEDLCFLEKECNFYSHGSGGECMLCTVCNESYDPETTNSYEVSDRLSMGGVTNFDSAGAALCFGKEGQCNPKFGASDLDDDMLNCYCPNNRKGTYTKKVKRTVANTKYCGSDASIDEKIREAQANRMFHLCENWCLFETNDPASQSWYWNPWLQCWREQFTGVGAHRSYCNRVISDPNTIEYQFIMERKDNFCA